MKSKSFVISAIILSLGGFFAKAIGAIYKIPLTNILGSSGMGLYYLVFPIYSLIITFCSSGIQVALSTEVAKCRKLRHRYNEQKLLRVSLVLSFALSLFFTIILIFVSSPLSEMQGNVNARFGYVAIAPAIILSSIISTLRGYFQGVENMIPTTVSLIIEQIVKLSCGLVLAHKLCNFGIQYAVMGAIVGVTLSEVVALIIISINFFVFKGQLSFNYRNMCYKGKKSGSFSPLLKTKMTFKKTSKTNAEHHTFKSTSDMVRLTTKSAIIKLLKTVIPATLSGIVIPIATMLDSFMIINLLTMSGYSEVVSTSLYGLWGGIVQSFISIPIILIAGLSTSLVPSLSGVVAGNDIGKISVRVKFFIKITWILSIFMFISIYVFAEDILRFLYGSGLRADVIDELYYATKMLKISSVSIIYYAFLQTFTAIMQSMDRSVIPFWALLISLLLRTMLVYLLVKIVNVNIFGAIIANIIFLSLTCIILAIFIKKYTNVDFYLFRHLFLPIIIGFLTLILMLLLNFGLKLIIHYFLSMVISFLVGLSLFLVSIWAFRVFDEREKREFFSRNRKITRDKKR